jgi:hypothetical protein
MAIFALRKQETKKYLRGSVVKSSVMTLGLLLGLIPSVLADTNGGVSPVPINFSNGTVTPFPIPSSAPAYAYIYNEYLLVTVGLTGGWGVTTPNTDIPGRISFGTFAGNLRVTQDNNQPLLGGVESLGTPGTFLGNAQWPYGFGDGLTTSTNGANQQFVNYPAYLRALVDGTTQVNVGFDTAQYRLSPRFYQTEGTAGSINDRPVLIAKYNIGASGNLYIEQRIRLVRTMTRIEWTIVNEDTQAHNVGLRWTMNLRGSNNFYFVNPDRGVSPRPVVLGSDPSTPGAIVPAIPDTLDVFSRRADTATDPGFHNRQIFRGLDSTLPLSVYLANASELAPGGGTPSGAYLPQAQGVRVPTFETGIASAAYYGNTPQGYVIPPLGKKVVVVYVGEGGTSDLVGDDLILSTESPTALPYYPGAATLSGVAGNVSATLVDVASKFIGTPVTGTDTSGNTVVTGVDNQFRIYASVYSQKQRLPDADVPLSGVSASLTLPPGLRFATDPATGVRDVSTKLVQPVGIAAGVPGELIGDQDGIASWLVEPTGEVYGPVTYQVAVGVARPNPLSRSVGRTITIPATPLVELATNTFQMVGFPFQFDTVLSNNGDPDTVINSLSRPIDQPVILYRWVPDPLSETGAGRYIKESKIEPGVAYFYRPGQGSGGKRLLYIKGAAPEALQAPTGNTLPVPLQRILEKGWNMISNPYVYDIPLNYLRVVPLEGNPSLSSISFGEAVRNNVIKGGVFYFSPSEGGYRIFDDLTSPLKPWQGYWIYVNSRVSVLFATPTQRDAVVLPDPVNSTPEPATRVQKDASAENWTLDIIARRADGTTDAATRIGISPNASESRTNMPKPPVFEQQKYVRMEIASGQGRYAQVLKTPGSKAAWNLELTSNTDGPVNVLLSGLSNVPKRMRLSLKDQQTGQVTNLRNISSLKVNVRKDAPSRFILTAVTEVTRPLRITQLRSVGAGSRATGGYAYVLGLTQDDVSVDATLTTVGGKPISVLAAGSRASANGLTKLIWNGRNQSGAAVPAGGYILSVRVTNGNGDSDMQRLPVVVTR